MVVITPLVVALGCTALVASGLPTLFFVGPHHASSTTLPSTVGHSSSTLTLMATNPNFNCTNPVVDCSGRGQCLNANACLCDDNYITFPSDNQYECNYKQTTRLAPFLLQFFLGGFTGCGAFMLGENAWGGGMIATVWGGVIILVVSSTIGNKGEVLVPCFTCLWICLTICLHVSILVFIGNGDFTDRDGAPMGSWT